MCEFEDSQTLFCGGPRCRHWGRGSGRFVGLDPLQKVGEDGSLRALELPLLVVQDLDPGDLCWHARIAGYLQFQGGQRDLEVWREPGCISISAEEGVTFGSAMVL